jgi:hypothetical protein
MATALAPSPALRSTRTHDDVAGPVTASVVVHLLMLAGYIAGYHGDISTLVCADSTRIGQFPFEAITYGFGTGGYDGQFYYVLARDPWHKDVSGVIDFQAYRHGRILFPALAWLLSGGGDPVLLMWVMPAINLASIGLLAWLGATLAKSYGRSTWLGFLLPLVLNVGPPAMRNLTDPLAATAVAGLVVGSVLGWHAVWLGLWATAALMSREQSVLIVFAILAYSWAAGRWSVAAAMATALGIWFAWLGVMYDYYNELPFATNTLTAPFVGLYWRWTHLAGSESHVYVLHSLGTGLLSIQLLLCLLMPILRVDRAVMWTALSGALLTLLASRGILEDWNSYMRVLLWMPLGIYVWAVQSGRRWPIALLCPAAVFPIIATPQGMHILMYSLQHIWDPIAVG